MDEEQLKRLAKDAGVSLDGCEDAEHIRTRVLLSCQEFSNF